MRNGSIGHAARAGAAMGVLLAGLGATAPAPATAGPVGGKAAELTEAMAETPVPLRAGLDRPREAYIHSQLGPIRQHGTDRMRIDADTIATLRADSTAKARAGVLNTLFGHDRDGDGRITVEEIHQSRNLRRTPAMPGGNPAKAKQVEAVMVADGDGDGVVTLREALAHANTKAAEAVPQFVGQLEALLRLDPDGDGTLTAQELEALARAAYARFDRDGNGIIDGEERAAMGPIRPRGGRADYRAATNRQIETCTLPPAAADATVVLVSANRGDALSNVSVRGLDRTTTVATLSVDRGRTPIYLVVSGASGIVWRIDGAVSRVAAVAVLPADDPAGPGAAVVGVPRDKLAFLEKGACFRRFYQPGGAARQGRAIVAGRLGRPVDTVITANMLIPTTIPSGTTAEPTPSDGVPAPMAYGPKPAEGVDPDTWRRLRSAFPGGAYNFDVTDVIAPGGVTVYDVLPREAGLIQLMRQGAISRLEDGFMLIRKPIPRLPADLPAGFTGGHRGPFMLGTGVPPAEGFSQSCHVISEETGRPLGPPSRCR